MLLAFLIVSWVTFCRRYPTFTAILQSLFVASFVYYAFVRFTNNGSIAIIAANLTIEAVKQELKHKLYKK